MRKLDSRSKIFCKTPDCNANGVRARYLAGRTNIPLCGPCAEVLEQRLVESREVAR